MGTVPRRSVALFVVALLAFTPPVLTLMNIEPSEGGFAPLPVYIFTAWGVVIFLAWYLDRRKRR